MNKQIIFLAMFCASIFYTMTSAYGANAAQINNDDIRQVLYGALDNSKHSLKHAPLRAEHPPLRDVRPRILKAGKSVKKYAVKIRKINLPGNVKLEMVKIEPGSFKREDGKTIYLSKPYWLGKYEVTQAQWKAVMGDNPSYFQVNGGGKNRLGNITDTSDFPVEQVSYEDVVKFCESLNNSGKAPKGWKFTLPTEAQWEYASRGGNKGTGYKYSGSNNADEVAWYHENSGNRRLNDSDWGEDNLSKYHCRTHKVGEKKANELGLYDMSGNVCEWCLDWHAFSYTDKTQDPTGPSDGSRRVVRGGSCLHVASLCRSAYRYSWRRPEGDHNYLGFRLALVPVQ